MSKSNEWYMRTNGEYDDDSGYEEWVMEQDYLNALREEARLHVMRSFVKIREELTASISVPYWEAEDVGQDDTRFHAAIWYASTQILPNFEVQVVIDANNKCFVSTGTAGYVEFGMQSPVGMKLPVKCWIHTHPFGVAYFSGIDIHTVSVWKNLMQSAYVLGGSGHYGYWEKDNPNKLNIYMNNELMRVQEWNTGEEE